MDETISIIKNTLYNMDKEHISYHEGIKIIKQTYLQLPEEDRKKYKHKINNSISKIKIKLFLRKYLFIKR